MDDAREQAEEWARDGEWGMDEDGAKTMWIDVTITEVLGERCWPCCGSPVDGSSGVPCDGDHIEANLLDEEPEEDSITVEIQPPEPDCTDGDHDWQSPQELVGGLDESPGVFGHGGGVIIHEVCMKCGTDRKTDSWAQDSHGVQGLTSVSYEPGKYEDEVGDEEE